MVVRQAETAIASAGDDFVKAFFDLLLIFIIKEYVVTFNDGAPADNAFTKIFNVVFQIDI